MNPTTCLIPDVGAVHDTDPVSDRYPGALSGCTAASVGCGNKFNTTVIMMSDCELYASRVKSTDTDRYHDGIVYTDELSIVTCRASVIGDDGLAVAPVISCSRGDDGAGDSNEYDKYGLVNIVDAGIKHPYCVAPCFRTGMMIGTLGDKDAYNIGA